ncbi:MAG TPA: hypothetical protein DCE42_23225 [Myxococcales bacterium]|nr:hypothetical protein [Myxococcales bacterium]
MPKRPAISATFARNSGVVFSEPMTSPTCPAAAGFVGAAGAEGSAGVAGAEGSAGLAGADGLAGVAGVAGVI